VLLGPDGIYYLVGTGTTAPWKCDGIPLYRSADLKTWELVKVVVWRDQFRDTWLLKDRKNVSIWAPELHFIKGNYYLTFCTDWARQGGVSGTGFLKSTTGKVEGPYELVNTDGPIRVGELDASFFQDDDGAVYYLSGGCSIARMKDDMSGLAEKVRRVGTEGGGTVGFEGISLFKRNGTYYLSVTDCKMPYKTYDCMVGMSNNVYGPYKNVHVAVPHGGHNVFFKDKEGNWWSTLFGGDTPEVSGPLKEQPSIVRVEFAPDGTIHPLDPALP
jgi:beta-xylosidase